MENKNLEKIENKDIEKSLDLQIKEKTDIVKNIMSEVILLNFSKEFGLTDQQIGIKKQEAQMFLIKLLGAKDVSKRPAILSVTPDSIRECALTYMNGEYDLFKNQGYLYPYGNELKFMVSKDGYVSLAKKLNPNIEDFYYDIVYRKDIFEFDKVAGKTIITKHKQSLDNITAKIDDIVCAYATCVFKDGTHIADIMTMAEIINSLKTAKKTLSDVHKDNPKIMLSKFPLRRLAKTKIYQSNPELAKVIIDDDENINDENKPSEIISIPDFDSEINKPIEVEIPKNNIEIIPETETFSSFEDEELSLEEMQQIVAEVEQAEKIEIKPEVEMPKELEQKKVTYYQWTHGLKESGEWEQIKGSWNANDKTLMIKRKEK